MAIGASAGGIDALKQFFLNLPASTGLSFVIILHLHPEKPDMLAELLDKHTGMPVRQAGDGMLLEPDHVYVIPPGSDMALDDGHLVLSPATRSHGLHLPVDTFLTSLAGSGLEVAVSVILSGTGSDGSLGLREVKEAGGLVIAQQPGEAQFDGMPASAIATGSVDLVLPVQDMAGEIIAFAGHVAKGDTQVDIQADMQCEADQSAYQRVLACIESQLGYNFFPYKQSTLRRRMQRRMGLCKLQHIGQYADYIEQHSEEASELFRDMLIGVTAFFRDPESWQELAAHWLDDLSIEDRPVRIWVPGCATGEEAYSLAMLLHEHMRQRDETFDYQIFATDIDVAALAAARRGIYPEGIAAHVPEEHLQRYFVPQEGGYRVIPALREHITFAEQNLISSPPYSRIDLISCRNLFIYLQAPMQQKLLDIFHFALGRDGMLLLGSSESVPEPSAYFRVVSKKWRLYRKINTTSPSRLSLPSRLHMPGGLPAAHPVAKEKKSMQRPTEAARQMLMQQYIPASVLVNRRFEVLSHYGDTSAFLRNPDGEVTVDLFAMLRDDLANHVRDALLRTIRKGCGARAQVTMPGRDGTAQQVELTVRCLPDRNGEEEMLLISFEAGGVVPQLPEQAEVPLQDQPLVDKLQSELKLTRAELQDTIEELLSSNEELKNAHHDAMLSNEELQSSNEELEASKEELQSFNEELNTVNSELQEKILSLEALNNDIGNLISSTKNASVFLDSEGNIKFFTPAALQLYKLIDSDVGRPLTDIAPRFDDAELGPVIAAVRQSGKPDMVEVGDGKARWFNCRVLPYLTAEGRVQGTVITFDDVSKLRSALDSMRQSERKYRGLFEHMLNGFAIHRIVCDEDGRPVDFVYLEVNDAFERLTGLARDKVVGRPVSEAIPGIENDETDWIGHYGRVVQSGESVRLTAYSRTLCKWYSVLAYSLGNGQFATIFEDVTEQREAAQRVAESERKFRDTFEQAAVGIAHVGLDGSWLRVNRKLPDMLGYDMDELMGMTFQDITHPDDLDADLSQVQRLLDGEADTYAMEKRYFRKDGSLLWINLTAALVRKQDGSPDYFISVIEDISQRKVDAMQLGEAKARLEAALHSTTDAVIITDANGDFVHFNDAFVDFHRFSSREECSNQLLDYPDVVEVLELDGSPIPMQDWPVLRALRGEMARNAEYCIRRKDIDVSWMASYSFSPIRTADGSITGTVVLGRDITEQKQAEQELMENRELFHQSQKMEALGTLVGGIAHDFNNILAGITGNLYLTRLQVKDMPAAVDHLRSAEKLSFRAAELIKQLLTFARKDSVRLKPLPIVPFIKETHKFMRTSVPENIAMPMRVECEELLQVRGDGTQLHQVLMNLINNARDALDGTASPFIALGLDIVETDSDLLRAHPGMQPGSYVHLSVGDNGEGIAAEHLEHVFEPFYTTKEQGRGTGLGLAMVFGAVQTHKGFIGIDSEPGRGSTFHIYLPAVHAGEAVVEKEVTQPDSGKGETILFADDNREVVETAGQVLQAMGYKVMQVFDGSSAVQAFSAAPESIDLVIIDIVMPGMDGVQAVDRMREINPGVKVLFSTGYDRAEALKNRAGLRAERTITKPYNYEALGSMIRKLLDTEPPAA